MKRSRNPSIQRSRRRQASLESLESRILLAGVEDASDCLGQAYQSAIQNGDFIGLDTEHIVEVGQDINQSCGLPRIAAIKNKINPLLEDVKQKWDSFRESNRWLRRFSESPRNFNDHFKSQFKESWVTDNCGSNASGLCRSVTETAVDQTIAAIENGGVSIDDFASIRRTLLAKATDELMNIGSGEAMILADAMMTYVGGGHLADAAQLGDGLFGGQFVDLTHLALPGPTQTFADDLPASAQTIIGPTGQDTYLDSLDWFGNFGPGDVNGSGDGFNFQSTSGSFSADWDSATGVSDVRFQVNGVGTYSEPDVDCSGSGGFGSTGDGVFFIDNGVMRVSGSLSGTAIGSCLVDTPVGQMTFPGNVTFNGTYSGTINPDFEFAGGFYDVNWSTDLASGAISGVWAADVDPATFDNSVTLVNDPVAYATSLAHARALAVGDAAAVYRNGEFVIDYANFGQNSRSVSTFQHTGMPVVGDFNGDGMTELGAYDAGLWQLDLDANGRDAERTLTFGSVTAMPVVGDWDGDGTDDLGLFENGTWSLRNADGTITQVSFGSVGQHPVAGDWDGDGDDELGLFSGGTWQLRDDNGSIANRFFGSGGSLPVVGDWDGDGIDSVAAVNSGQWDFDLDDQGGVAERSLAFGESGDIPLAGFWADFAFDSSLWISGDTPKTIPDLGTMVSELIVTDDFVVNDLDVHLDIDHGWTEDLDAFLIAPDGTRVELFTDVGGDGDSFIGLILDDSASTSIANGTAPFTGRFRPEGLLASFNGRSANGTWVLEISDDEEFLDGEILDWSLNFDHRNTPPQLTSAADAAISAGDSVSTLFAASDDETQDQLRFSLDVAPDGATINSTTGQFQWSSTAADVGLHEIVVRVVDQGTPPLTDTVAFKVDVLPLASDYGDAPTASQSGFANSYPTLDADDGAAHQIKPGFFLGTSIDADDDGQPEQFAEGDDLDSDGNDDDGIVGFSDFAQGASLAIVEVQITNDAGVAAPYLDAWIDFNQNGIWETPAERVASLPVEAGVFQFGFPVPADALLGDTFARIRLHEATGPGLLPTGLASSGEVEDYELTIVELAYHWQNEANPLDVDTVNGVTINDAFAVVAVLRDAGSAVVPLPVILSGGNTPPPFVDVDRNNLATLNDALLIVAFLRDQLSGGEGEAVLPEEDLASENGSSSLDTALLDDDLADIHVSDDAWTALLSEMAK